MSDQLEALTEEERRRRFGHRAVQAFSSMDSYGLVLLLIVASYIFAISVTARWAMSAVLAVQIATVLFSLHTSRARRSVRIVASVLMAVAAVIAIVHLIVPDSAVQLSGVFIAASLLYLIAPFSILNHLLTRKVVDL